MTATGVPPTTIGIAVIGVATLIFMTVGVAGLVWPERVRDWGLWPLWHPDGTPKWRWMKGWQYPLSKEVLLWCLRFVGVISLIGAVFAAAFFIAALTAP
jgi:hypothetical protein